MLSKKEEENIHGFTGDIKDFLREDDFESALILFGDPDFLTRVYWIAVPLPPSFY